MAEVDFYMFFGDIIPILVLALAGAIFIGIMMFLSVISRPRPKQSDLKLQTYECGEEPYEDRIGIQFNYQYFIYAIVFTALDVLAVFLYSWAISGDDYLYFALIPLGIFVGMLLLAFGYTAFQTRDWKKNVL